MEIKNLYPLIDKLVDDPKVEKKELLTRVIEFVLKAKNYNDNNGELDNIFEDCIKTITKILNDIDFWHNEHKLTTDNLISDLIIISRCMDSWKEACSYRQWTKANLLFQKIQSFTKEFTYDEY